MKRAFINGWRSFLKLLRFLVWYAIAVAALFLVLPMAGLFVEDQYETMSSSAKFFSVVGFFIAIVAWQVISIRDRRRKLIQGKAVG